MPQTFSIVITVNSPGEVSGWLKPTVKAIREWNRPVTITVFIPPCTFASGTEKNVVQAIPGIDLVVTSSELFRYIVLGRKPKGFHPSPQGIVLFLGGDLTYAALLAKRLKYPALAYSEGVVNWTNIFRYFATPYPKNARKLAAKGAPASQIRTIGNLMLDAIPTDLDGKKIREELKIGDKPVLLLMPSSRPEHFEYMLPFLIQVSGEIHKQIPGLYPVISISPFITDRQLAGVLTGESAGVLGVNGIYKDGQTVQGVTSWEQPGSFLTSDGTVISAFRGRQYELMAAADLAISLPGTNTFELTAFGVPTIVTLPLTHPERIPIEGPIGLLGKIPGFGGWLKRTLLPRMALKIKYTSWPNRLAEAMITPEVRGLITAGDVSAVAVSLLADPEERKRISGELRKLVGERGAAPKLVQLMEIIISEHYGGFESQ